MWWRMYRMKWNKYYLSRDHHDCVHDWISGSVQINSEIEYSGFNESQENFDKQVNMSEVLTNIQFWLKLLINFDLNSILLKIWRIFDFELNL